MDTVIPPEYVRARHVLLDALEALEAHLEALILVGAQAVYEHTGDSDLAIAPTTTDADIALNASQLADEPLIDDALRSAGFTLAGNPGTWKSSSDIAVDLMVAAEQQRGTGGRRGARLGVHGNKAARKTLGLEPALIDNSPIRIASFDPDDSRMFTIKVAGPTALLIAKLIKINERLDQPHRRQPKDALDVLRIMRAVETEVLSRTFRALFMEPICNEVSSRAFEIMREQGTDPAGPLAKLAVEATLGLEDPDTVAGSLTGLIDELIQECESPA
jgi:hypothetical protein